MKKTALKLRLSEQWLEVFGGLWCLPTPPTLPTVEGMFGNQIRLTLQSQGAFIVAPSVMNRRVIVFAPCNLSVACMHIVPAARNVLWVHMQVPVSLVNCKQEYKSEKRKLNEKINDVLSSNLI